jgi:RHS repeat-associated protein
MPSVSWDSSLGYSAMLPANWMPQSDPTIPSFGDVEVKNGIQAPHVAPSSEKEHFRHKSMVINELQRFKTPKKTGGVTVYGYRHYTPKTGQFLGRDPIEEKGGMNLYGMVNNDLVSRWDLLGMWVNADMIIDSKESISRVQSAQDLGKSIWRLALSKGIVRVNLPLLYWIYKHKTFFELVTIGYKHHPGDNTDGNNRFVYTCRYGWIDMGHFFYSAAFANILGAKTAYGMGVQIEKIQDSLKRVPGMEGFSESAWTPEDLISDYHGSMLGNDVGLSGIPKENWLNFLAQAGVVAHKGNAKSILANDVNTWKEERFKSYNGALEWQWNRHAHKCLCDGFVPKPGYRD